MSELGMSETQRQMNVAPNSARLPNSARTPRIITPRVRPLKVGSGTPPCDFPIARLSRMQISDPANTKRRSSSSSMLELLREGRSCCDRLLLITPRPTPPMHKLVATYRHPTPRASRPNVQHEPPTLLSCRVVRDVHAKKHSDADLVAKDVLSREPTGRSGEDHNQGCDKVSATNVETHRHSTPRASRPNVHHEPEHEPPTLLSCRVVKDVHAKKHSDADLVAKDVLSREPTERINEDRNQECDKASATNVEFLKTALQGACDGSHHMSASLATVRLLLINDIISHSRAERLAGTEPKAVGQALLERLFSQTMPSDLFEVVSIHKINQTHGMSEFFNLLASKASSLNVEIMFSANDEEKHQETPFACIAHRMVSKSADDQGILQMRIAIVAMDPNSNEKQVLHVRILSYRLTEIGKKMSDRDREDGFQSALAKAMKTKKLLSIA